MMTARTSMIALTALGAVVLGSVSPSLAAHRDRADRGAVAHKYRGETPGTYALDRRYWFNRTHPGNFPSPYERPFLRWDPYGARWDGAD